MSRLRVLVAGLGSIGQRHVRNLRTLLGQDVDIMAFRRRGTSPLLGADMSVKGGPEALEAAHGIRAFSSLEAALAEKPHAVFITNPNTEHLSVALAAARAGCHLFVEKPLSHTMEGLDELIRIVDEQRLVGFVAYQFRFHPALVKMKELVSSGQIGRVAAAHIVNAEHLPDWHPYEDYRETHPARKDLGGGCLRIQTHELDYALHLFGLPQRAFAVGGHLSSLELQGVEDSVSVLLACGTPEKTYPVHIHLDYIQRPPQRFCEIIGDRARLRFDYYAQRLEIAWTFGKSGDSARKAEIEVISFEGFERNSMFIDELKHFLACMEGKEGPLVDFREARRSMLVSEAAHASMQTGRAIEIRDV